VPELRKEIIKFTSKVEQSSENKSLKNFNSSLTASELSSINPLKLNIGPTNHHVDNIKSPKFEEKSKKPPIPTSIPSALNSNQGNNFAINLII
jgi:hypothetical protein